MLLTNHVLSGALTGALVRRPLASFTIGVASHFVLDAIPHWGEWGGRRKFLRVAVCDGLISLSVMGAFAAMAPPDRRMAVLAGMTGAALPDIDKPTRLWFGWSPWPGPVDRFHGAIQDEASDRAPLEFLASCVLAAAALTALQRPSATRLASGRAANASPGTGSLSFGQPSTDAGEFLALASIGVVSAAYVASCKETGETGGLRHRAPDYQWGS